MALVAAFVLSGCTSTGRKAAGPELCGPAQALVIAPVINLSGNQNFDALKVTDILASEVVSFPNVTAIPVNLTLAALAKAGKTRVETPEDAIALAREFNADATLVVAVTEFDPYDPPVVGLIMQWYVPSHRASQDRAEPAGESAVQAASDAAQVPISPRLQVQKVFNAAREDVSREVRHFAKHRDTGASPYGWKRYVQSQELYLRYCCWAMFRTMLTQNGLYPTAIEPDEAES
jgi:hypothetical protein